MFPLGFLLPKVTSFRPRDRERMVIKSPGVERTWAATGLAGLPALRTPAGRSPLWCWNQGRYWILTVHEDGQGNSTAGSHRRAGRGKHGSPLVVNQMKPLAQACRIPEIIKKNKKKPAQLERRRLLAERLETILRPPNLLFGRAVCAQNPRSSKKLRAVARLFAGHLILIGRYKALALCALLRHHKARAEDQIVAILFFPTPPFGREGSRTTGRGGSRILPDLLVNQEHVPSQAYHLDGRWQLGLETKQPS